MRTQYKVGLETLFGNAFSIASRIPDEACDLRFIGYDSSGASIDPNGVLRVSFSSEPGSDLMELLSHKEISVKATKLDEEISELEKKIISMKKSIYIDNNYHEKMSKISSRLELLKELKRQVEESLEDPHIYRELKGIRNYGINGVTYRVDSAWTQTQMGERPSYYLKGDELVVSDAKQKILAYRYLKDPRVVVHGSFEGDYRRTEKWNLNLDEQTKTNLAILFKNMYPEIEEVCFPNSERRKVN